MIQPPVLVYHRISRRPLLAGTWVTPTGLADHLDRLLQSGLRALNGSEWLAASGNSARSGFLLTFDDATEDLHRYRHLLRDRKVPALVFAPVSLLGAVNHWEWPLPSRRARHLSAAQLRELQELPGGWEIGLHGATHCDLTNLSDAELKRELDQGRAQLAEILGREVRFISYPYGRVDARVAACAGRAGFLAGFVVAKSITDLPAGLAWQRRPVYCIDGPGDVLVKITDPRGRTWRGRWELSKERAAHAVGHWTATLRRGADGNGPTGERPG